LSGLRKNESTQSFNLIIDLYRNDRLGDYFNADLSILEHYKFRQFLRNTENAYITVIPRPLLMKIANNRPVSYNAIHVYLYRNKIKLRIKELRQFFGTFMVRHNLIREELDLLQGRVSKSIFVRH
jgi:intergrase/recombinase